MATTITIIEMVQWGLGKHVKQLTKHEAFMQQRAVSIAPSRDTNVILTLPSTLLLQFDAKQS